MKNKKECPKCSSIDIVRIPGTVSSYGIGNNISLGALIFSSVKVTRYLCGNCGFTEEWIDEASDISKIKNKYEQNS